MTSVSKKDEIEGGFEAYPISRSSTTRSSTTTGELAVTSVSKKDEIEGGFEPTFKADLELAEPEQNKFGRVPVKTIEPVTGHNGKRIILFI